MNSNMLLSIIIPCYNSGRFIAKTLDMLINQGLQSCEVIVVNDGSTDKTAEIVSEYTRNYSNIHLVNKCNEGVSVARNTGINVANGEYIYFLDSDDTLSPGTLTFFKETIGANLDTEMFAFGYKSYRDGKLLKKYIYKKFDKRDFSAEEIQKAFLSKSICINICSSLYKKSFLIGNKLHFTPGIHIGEDIEFILKSLSAVSTIHYEARGCFIYQIRNDSAMQGYKKYSQAQFNSFLLNCKVINEIRYPQIKEECDFFLLNSYLSNLVYYLLSDFKDNEVSEKFISFSYILKNKTGKNKKILLLVLVIRLFKLKNIFLLFKK